MCDGCNASLTGLSALTIHSVPRASVVHREVARDLRRSDLAILILSIIAIIGLVIVYSWPRTFRPVGLIPVLLMTFLVLMPALYLIFRRSRRMKERSTV